MKISFEHVGPDLSGEGMIGRYHALLAARFFLPISQTPRDITVPPIPDAPERPNDSNEARFLQTDKAAGHTCLDEALEVRERLAGDARVIYM